MKLGKILCSCCVVDATLTNKTINPPIKIIIKIKHINPENTLLYLVQTIRITLNGTKISLLKTEEDCLLIRRTPIKIIISIKTF